MCLKIHCTVLNAPLCGILRRDFGNIDLPKKRINNVKEKDGDGVTYYQVSASVLDENTLKRELEPLQRISDHHPKYLLTLDEIGAGANYDGIRQLNLIDWLADN